jgi:hypothetical protein
LRGVDVEQHGFERSLVFADSKRSHFSSCPLIR